MTDDSASPLASRLDPGLIVQLRDALPRMREWMLAYTQLTASHARPVASLSVPGLSRCYSQELLGSARVVITDQICYPPLDQFGLGEFNALSETPWAGITYDQTYFLRRDADRPALHFHELVHAVQYARLGVERFLWAYGVGIALHGYDESPLEKMAYDLQLEFEHGIYRRSLVADIERRSDLIWQEASLEAGSVPGAAPIN